MGRHSEAKAGYFCLMRRGNGYYYYWVYDRFGRRIYRSTGQRTRAQAMKVALARWQDGSLIEQPKPEYHRFGDYAAGFWNWDTCPIIQERIRRGGHYSRENAEINAKMTAKHITPYFKDQLIEAITTKQISDWILRLPEEHHLARKSCNNVLTVFRQMLDAAVADGLIDRNPAKAVKPLIKDYTQPRGCYSSEQIKAIFSGDWEPLHVRIMCRISAMTGMRLGEVQALIRRQVKDGYLEVDASWAKKEGRKTTKSGYRRVVPLDPETMNLIREILPPHDDDLLFTQNGREPISGNTVRRYLTQRMDELGIDWKAEALVFHSFRHFFNTRLVAAGVDGEITRAVIGHESQDMTEHYLHLTAEDMEGIRAVQRGIAL